MRKSHEAPTVVAGLGWQYHHLGIPYTEPRAGERHIERLGIHVCGFETSPYGIEWIRFDSHCAVPEIVRTVPHIAFEVDDLDRALVGKQILIAPNAPSPGVRVAFILDDGRPSSCWNSNPSARPKPGEAGSRETIARPGGTRLASHHPAGHA
jgi:hypothetical protein